MLPPLLLASYLFLGLGFLSKLIADLHEPLHRSLCERLSAITTYLVTGTSDAISDIVDVFHLLLDVLEWLKCFDATVFLSLIGQDGGCYEYIRHNIMSKLLALFAVSQRLFFLAALYWLICTNLCHFVAAVEPYWSRLRLYIQAKLPLARTDGGRTNLQSPLSAFVPSEPPSTHLLPQLLSSTLRSPGPMATDAEASRCMQPHLIQSVESSDSEVDGRSFSDALEDLTFSEAVRDGLKNGYPIPSKTRLWKSHKTPPTFGSTLGEFGRRSSCSMPLAIPVVAHHRRYTSLPPTFARSRDTPSGDAMAQD